MTEAEWLACDDQRLKLAFIRREASDRKCRLFACACCRRAWHLLVDQRSRNAVEVSEQYADGLVSRDELATAQDAAAKAGKERETEFMSTVEEFHKAPQLVLTIERQQAENQHRKNLEVAFPRLE